MFREFVEEVEYPALGWEGFALLKGVEKDGKPYEVGFFRADVPPEELTRVIHSALEYDEKPEWWPVDGLPADVLPNLRFLIPMANPIHCEAWPFTIEEGRPNPQDAITVSTADATRQP